MVFLLFSYGFSMVLLWFSYGCPMVFLWFSYGFPMVFPWFSYGFLWFPIVFLLFSYGFPMVFLLFSYGFPMIFLWFSYGFQPKGQIPNASSWTLRLHRITLNAALRVCGESRGDAWRTCLALLGMSRCQKTYLEAWGVLKIGDPQKSPKEFV